mmetsp:Transcript_32201/g.70158  ORF Transcript_32201/g.70158 Transcript_32201/m.70158 type:complete len:303 (-) Transcript_32201:385-1293(-)
MFKSVVPLSVLVLISLFGLFFNVSVRLVLVELVYEEFVVEAFDVSEEVYNVVYLVVDCTVPELLGEQFGRQLASELAAVLLVCEGQFVAQPAVCVLEPQPAQNAVDLLVVDVVGFLEFGVDLGEFQNVFHGRDCVSHVHLEAARLVLVLLEFGLALSVFGFADAVEVVVQFVLLLQNVHLVAQTFPQFEVLVEFVFLVVTEVHPVCDLLLTRVLDFLEHAADVVVVFLDQLEDHVVLEREFVLECALVLQEQVAFLDLIHEVVRLHVDRVLVRFGHGLLDGLLHVLEAGQEVAHAVGLDQLA